MRIRDLLAARLGGALLLVGLAACDAAPGVAPAPGRPPVLSDFTFGPSSVVLNDLPPDQVSGETARVPLTLGVTVTDPDGPVAAVRYVVLSPQQNAAPLATGTLARAASGRFEATPTVDIPSAEAGLYTVLLYAVDVEGSVSNQVRGLLRVTAVGAPPVIESVDVPDEIQRPPTGQTETLRISAVVSDPDGLANILRVEMRPNGGSPILLCDDGGGGPCGPFQTSGDVEAGDGRFTITVQISSTNTLGENVFDFQAFDRFGERSDVVTRRVRIVE